MTYFLERHEASGTVSIYRNGTRIGYFWPDPQSDGFAAFLVGNPKPIARPKTEPTCVLKITGGQWDGAGQL